MKCWIVPSSMIIRNNWTPHLRLCAFEEEVVRLKAREVQLREELSRMPAKIAAAQALADKWGAGLQPFRII